MTVPTADFFSGFGGFSEGATQAGCEVLFAANHDEAACLWHRANHPSTWVEQQDLHQLDMTTLPDIDLLLAAPACQGHSECGQPAAKGSGGSHKPCPTRARGRHDRDRSTAWAVLPALDAARPKVCLIENVGGLARWPLYRSWLQVIKDMGYHVRDHVLDARTFGSSQHRERLIISCSLGGPIDLAPGDQVAGTIAQCLDLEPEHPDHRWTDIEAKPERMRWRMRKAQREAGSVCVWNNVSESRGRPLDDCFPTLTTQAASQVYVLDGDRGRIVNSRELARAQGFPDSYKLPRNREVAGKLIGNAIDVRMARGVVEQVLSEMN